MFADTPDFLVTDSSGSCDFRLSFDTVIDTGLSFTLSASGFSTAVSSLMSLLFRSFTRNASGFSLSESFLPVEDGRLLSRILSDDCALMLLGRNLLVEFSDLFRAAAP